MCQCITHSGTGGNEWGALIIAPNNSYNSNGNRSSVRIGHNASSSSGGGGGHNNKTDCLVVYIRAAPDEIVELRFYEIRLRERYVRFNEGIHTKLLLDLYCVHVKTILAAARTASKFMRTFAAPPFPKRRVTMKSSARKTPVSTLRTDIPMPLIYSGRIMWPIQM